MEVSSLRHQLIEFSTETPIRQSNNRNAGANRSPQSLPPDMDSIFDKSEMDQLLIDARNEKQKFETIVRQLREQLTMAETEVKKLRHQLALTESDSKEEIQKLIQQIKSFEMKCNEFRETNEQLIIRLKFAEHQKLETELSAQRLAIEDRRQLMIQLSDKNRLVAELQSSLADKQHEINRLNGLMAAEHEEWHQFQKDLLTTVRVAEEFKTETLLECQKVMQINRDLETKLADLEIELKKYKTSDDNALPTVDQNNEPKCPPVEQTAPEPPPPERTQPIRIAPPEVATPPVARDVPDGGHSPPPPPPSEPETKSPEPELTEQEPEFQPQPQPSSPPKPTSLPIDGYSPIAVTDSSSSPPPTPPNSHTPPMPATEPQLRRQQPAIKAPPTRSKSLPVTPTRTGAELAAFDRR
ncbi:unnamed protein product, partial [Medioppia subpectinata]